MPDQRAARFPVVGIGASAGGIEAFKGFFEHMSPDSGMAFVVILHLPADRKSLLPEILGRWTSMRVVEAEEGCLVEPNSVYLPPPGIVVTLRDGRLHPHRLGPNDPREPTPIDMFFNSLASELNEDAIGVVLSGSGSDGTLGLKAIKACGGLTLAQGVDGTAPQHDGMPASAIAAGAVDIIASVEAIPTRLMNVNATRRDTASAGPMTREKTDTARLAICEIVHRQIGHDFSQYKEKTFLRRVQRRMQVRGVTSYDEYIVLLQSEREEITNLFRDLLISVTSFFRDTDTFETLRQRVLPSLFHNKAADTTIRVWVAGCATGEEAYSLAMLLREHADRLDGAAPHIQVFATDIDEAAIATARAGRYPSVLLQGMSAERLARFFVEGTDGSYTVAKGLRELCTFSAHSLTRHPPFSRMDLVSCRNLLIYLDADLQAAVIPAFHYALVPDGILLLGSSETISRHEDLFSTLDRNHRIFRKRNVLNLPLPLTGRIGRDTPPSSNTATSSSATRIGISKLINRANARVLDRFAPAYIVVNAEGDILQYSSHTGRFLEPASGLPSQNVLAMARRGLRPHLRAVLKKSVETGRPAEKQRVTVEIAGEGIQKIALVVEPISDQGDHTAFLIVFIESVHRGGQTAADTASETDFDTNSNRQLEAELRDTREQLQSVTEEHGTSLEELKSANEELHSVNEELQSTNEELETSKEEIQSINEELQTVNAQLASKVDELDEKNSDLRNLFESTQVATIFLDPYLVIRGFTPAIANVYNLIPSDQGRPLTDIVSRLRYSGLREDIKTVLDTLEPLERRVVRDDESMHYLMRILPYRTPESAVDGTLITFVDVTSIVQAEQHQRLLVDELNHRVKNMLTVVISLATQTMRRSQTMEEFSDVYMGRVHALTAAYSLLSNEGWQTVPLREIVAEEIRPFLSMDRTNIVLEGPVVPLEPQAALSLGMAIHELTTNAVKYGALSIAEGNVSITWRVAEDHDGGQELILTWVERDGPRVATPTRRGFGMTLIERGLKQDMSAEVEVEFDEAGIKAVVRAPLSITSKPISGP